jgi:cyanate permease
LCAAWLFVLVGWRGTWAILGVVAPLLVVVPALVFIRRRPEDVGLAPDGESPAESMAGAKTSSAAGFFKPGGKVTGEEARWTRSEVLRLPAFWLLVATFGMASVGIAGLNLHIFPFISDIGYSPLVGATVMSMIALTQLGTTLIWGALADRFDIRKVSCVQFVIQGIGLVMAVASTRLSLVYAGFLFYGIGLAGSFIIREVIWANFFGRSSLGTVRGVSLFFSHLFAASGAPFFGFLFDATGNYHVSFSVFAAALFTSSILILMARPPSHAN